MADIRTLHDVHDTRDVSRRRFMSLAAAGAGAVALSPLGTAASASPVTDGGGDRAIVRWIDRNATPLHDLRPLRRIVGDAAIVGLGESAHGTGTVLALKQRVAQFLVEDLGFRTIAWEESWGAGVAVDRYVTSGVGDVRAVVQDAMFMLQTEAMVDLVTWMRDFNRGRPAHDRVRFLGSDVLELRPVQFDEIVRFVTDVAPHRLAELRGHLDEIGLHGEAPWEHLGWYSDLSVPEQEVVIAQARAVHQLVVDLARRGHGRSAADVVDPADAVQHALTILGFYDANTERGDEEDRRERYIVATLEAWRARTGHRVAYSAANAHTAGNRRVVVSFPDGEPGDDTVEREMAGGLLRRRLGRRYVSIGSVFHRGAVLTGWEVPGGPAVYDLPPPDPRFVDHVLGRARLGDYVLDLRDPHDEAPPPVRRWLDGPATTRILSSAYVAENDFDYSLGVDGWQAGFDAVLHVEEVTAAQLLAR